MAKTNEKGPRKLNSDAYNELVKEEAQKHADILANKGSVGKSSDVQWMHN